MAWTGPSQVANAGGSGTHTATFTNTPTQGDVILISFEIVSATPVTSVQDGNGNNCTLVNSVGIGSPVSRLLYQYMIVAGAAQSKSITVNPGSGITVELLISEFTPVAGSHSAIVDNGQTETGAHTGQTATSGVSVTTQVATDLIWTSVGLNGTSGIATMGTTNCTLLQQLPASTSSVVADAYQIETSTGTFTPTFNWTTSRAWAQITTALTGAAIAGTAAASGHYTMSATGAITLAGTAAASVEATMSASGSVKLTGTAALAAHFTASATGVVKLAGAATLAVHFTAAATSSSHLAGSASMAVGFVAAAQGVAPTPVTVAPTTSRPTGGAKGNVTVVVGKPPKRKPKPAPDTTAEDLADLYDALFVTGNLTEGEWVALTEVDVS